MLQTSLLKLLMDSRIKLTAILVVLMLLAYQISVAVWRFVPEPEGFNQAGIVTQNRAQVVEKGQQSYLAQANAIGSSYLFGKAEVVVTEPQQTADETPETKLNYKLRGIYFSEESAFSSAIVEVKPNNSQYFRVGDEFADKIAMSAIGKDHIIIDRYGKLERLNLQKPTVSSSAETLAGDGVRMSPVASTRLLQSYKKRYVSNPLALAKRFQAIPVQENGRNVGFRLKALRGESLLKKLDFEPNDVFTKINGISLDKPFEALDALKSLTTANSVSVTILRNGSEQTMDFTL